MTRHLAIITERTIEGATETECGTCEYAMPSIRWSITFYCSLFDMINVGHLHRCHACLAAERAAETLKVET